jgi:hypothetical protein
MSDKQERPVTLVTSPKNSGLSVSLPVILAAGRSASGTSDPNRREAIDQALARGVQVTYERPLTPEELQELGIGQGQDFAEMIREAMTEAPVLMLGAIRDRG